MQKKNSLKTATTSIFNIRKNCKDYIKLHYQGQGTELLDLDLILCYLLNKDRTWLFTHDDTILSEKEYQGLLDLCKLRSTGLPIAYITNNKEFYGYDFFVNPSVLIPKPDTEVLVEKALEIIQKKHYTNLADICTGSGCIAISILKELENNNYKIDKIYATDISEDALKVSKTNGKKLVSEHLDNDTLCFFQGDLCNPLIEQNISVDMIISNPPYVPSPIVDKLLEDGRNEPRLALDGNIDNEDGLKIIKRLIIESHKVLKNNGTLLMETGEYNADETGIFMKEIGFQNVQIFLDYSGMKRVVKGEKI